MPPEHWSKSSSWRTRGGSRNPDPSDSGRGLSSGSRIYVGNMPYTAQRKDVEGLLQAEGFEFANIDISIDLFTSRNPSYCFVDMHTLEDAERAMRVLSGKPLRGRPLKVKPCVQKRSAGLRPHSDPLDSTRWKERSGQSSRQRHDLPELTSPPPNSATDLLIPLQEDRCLFIGGLPRPIDNHSSDLELREMFAGHVVEAVSKVKWPIGGSMHGSGWYAFVDLRTAEDARRAIAQLHGVTKWGEEITIRLARGAPDKVLDTIAAENQEQNEDIQDSSLIYD